MAALGHDSGREGGKGAGRCGGPIPGLTLSWGGGQERVDGSGSGWRNYGDGGGAGVQEEAARGCELAEELGGAPRPYLWAAKAVEGVRAGRRPARRP